MIPHSFECKAWRYLSLFMHIGCPHSNNCIVPSSPVLSHVGKQQLLVPVGALDVHHDGRCSVQVLVPHVGADHLAVTRLVLPGGGEKRFRREEKWGKRAVPCVGVQAATLTE